MSVAASVTSLDVCEDGCRLLGAAPRTPGRQSGSSHAEDSLPARRGELVVSNSP
jgi:hypothetical protein